MMDSRTELALRLQVVVELTSGVGRTILEQAPSLPEWELRGRVGFLLALLEGPLEALRPAPPSASASQEQQLDLVDLPF